MNDSISMSAVMIDALCIAFSRKDPEFRPAGGIRKTDAGAQWE
jgi:hypothetical protein